MARKPGRRSRDRHACRQADTSTLNIIGLDETAPLRLGKLYLRMLRGQLTTSVIAGGVASSINVFIRNR